MSGNVGLIPAGGGALIIIPMAVARPQPTGSRAPIIAGVGLATLAVIVVLVATRRSRLQPNWETLPTATTEPASQPTEGLAIAAAPIQANWKMYQVTDPQDPAVAYTFGVPPGSTAKFREFGFDVEVTDEHGETLMTISRYRGKDGNLKISVEGYRVIRENPFEQGAFPGREFILETPPEKFTPAAPVWWLNSPRQEVHLPIPPLKWVVVFSASMAVPAATFEQFAASFQLPP